MGILSWLSGKFFDPKPTECVHDWEVVECVSGTRLATEIAKLMESEEGLSYADALCIASEMDDLLKRKVCIKCNCIIDEAADAIRVAKEKIIHAGWRKRVAREVWANRNK